MAASEAFYAPVVSPSGVYRYYIEGAWKESSSGATVAIINPSTRQPEYKVQGERWAASMGQKASGESAARALALGALCGPTKGAIAPKWAVLLPT